MPKQYSYVGPPEINRRATSIRAPAPIQSLDDLYDQLQQLGFQQNSRARLIVTFIVDADGYLRIADRHSEHVACAAGGNVQTAGEMTFRWNAGIEIECVTNQSTGYCPEVTSWTSVTVALEKLRLPHPPGFDPGLEFRRCPGCSQINIVKDNLFVCCSCGVVLPGEWNLS